MSNNERAKSVTIRDEDWIRFLLAEHSYFADSFWHSEEVGEKRMNYISGLVTAFFAALLTLGSIIGVSPTFYLFSIASLLFLLMIGITVLLRMIHRSKETDKWKARLDLIREQFQENVPRESYNPFGDRSKPVLAEIVAKYPKRELRKGGLTTMAAVINSSLVAAIGLFTMLYLEFISIFHLLFGVVFFGLISSLGQVMYIWRNQEVNAK